MIAHPIPTASRVDFISWVRLFFAFWVGLAAVLVRFLPRSVGFQTGGLALERLVEGVDGGLYLWVLGLYGKDLLELLSGLGELS